MSDASDFLEKAWSAKGPKVIAGFSRPIYHNLQGLLYGYKYEKKAWGGMIRHTEAGMLTRWASQVPRGGNIVEIGCYGGLSTSYLLNGVLSRAGHVYSIDPFNSELDKQAELTDNCVSLEDKPTKTLVTQRLDQNGFRDHYTLIENYSQQAAREWDPSITIDFLWIDGNHEQALQDFRDFEPFLNPGARVAFHDAHPRYGYMAVVEDVRKVFAQGDWSELEQVKSIITGRLGKNYSA